MAKEINITLRGHANNKRMVAGVRRAATNLKWLGKFIRASFKASMQSQLAAREALEIYRSACVTPRTRKYCDKLARRLLVHMVMKGRTLQDIEDMVLTTEQQEAI